MTKINIEQPSEFAGKIFITLVLGHKLYSKISSNMVNSKMSQLKTPMDLEGNDMFWIHTTILM